MIKIKVKISTFVKEKEEVNLDIKCDAVSKVYPGGFSLIYSENNAVNHLSYENNILYIKRKAKDSVNTMCFKNNFPSSFVIETKYAQMDLDIYTLEMIINSEIIYIKYIIKNELDAYRILKINLNYQ